MKSLPHEPSRFEIAVAAAVAAAVGILAFVLVGMEVFAVALLTLPAAGPVLLDAAALAGVWLAVRGRRTAKGFGAGLVIGCVLLAVLTSGASVGLDIFD
ncbi:hypothetical protein [Amycolatopsis anabasis]|uniref:hypothetical protein n=1 Tax=Amycolatopsis anabasis TaxID=1840409 RepID=UPI00131A900D|nr:hypothetical protein [Amycolatopsis anabasis]